MRYVWLHNLYFFFTFSLCFTFHKCSIKAIFKNLNTCRCYRYSSSTVYERTYLLQIIEPIYQETMHLHCTQNILDTYTGFSSLLNENI